MDHGKARGRVSVDPPTDGEMIACLTEDFFRHTDALAVCWLVLNHPDPPTAWIYAARDAAAAFMPASGWDLADLARHEPELAARAERAANAI